MFYLSSEQIIKTIEANQKMEREMIQKMKEADTPSLLGFITQVYRNANDSNDAIFTLIKAMPTSRLIDFGNPGIQKLSELITIEIELMHEAKKIFKEKKESFGIE